MAPERTVSRTRSGRKEPVQTTLRQSPRRGSAIVVASSSSEGGVEVISGSSKRTTRAAPRVAPAKRKHAVPPDAEIVEISSGEDEPPPPTSVEVKRLKAQLDKLQQQLSQSKLSAEKDKAKLSKEIAQLKQTDGKTALDANELEDTVTCEICASRMWSPYITPNCGHSFCGTCLKEWFDKILSTHIQHYPNYNVDTLQHQQLLAYAPDAADALRTQLGIPPEAHFTCPHCRTRVMRPPTENRALQTIVRLSAQAAKEKSPKKPTRPATQERLWGKFFPKHTFW